MFIVGDSIIPIEWIVSLQADTYTSVEALRRHSVDGDVPVETLLLRVTDYGAPIENVRLLEFAQRGPFEFTVRTANDTSGNLEVIRISAGEARAVIEWLSGAGAFSDNWVPLEFGGFTSVSADSLPVIEFGNDATGFLVGGGAETTRFIANLVTFMNRRGG